MSDEAFSAWFDALYTRYASDIIRVSYFWAIAERRRTSATTRLSACLSIARRWSLGMKKPGCSRWL